MLLVQCDFDDTITVGNVSSLIRTKFAPDEWREMEDEYFAGRYSVEESNIRQYALMRAARTEIEDYVRTHVMVREAFEEFVHYCHREGIRLAVVSSGLDLYIRPTMQQLGLDRLDVYSGNAQVNRSGIQVGYTDPSSKSLTRGFKESYLRHFKTSDYTVIYIGDGLSDIVPATEADFVIARSELEQHFSDNALPFYTFRTFKDVAGHVEEIRRQIEG